MPEQFNPVFVLNIAGTFLAFGVVAAVYIWPGLRRLSRYQALTVLLLPQAFRFMGLSFLIPGVVSSDLPSQFATAAAWGDFAAAILALLSLLVLRLRWAFAIPLVWFFNLWGSADLLYAYYQGGVALQIDPGLFGTAYYIPTMIVPPLLILHALTFILLVRPDDAMLPQPNHAVRGSALVSR